MRLHSRLAFLLLPALALPAALYARPEDSWKATRRLYFEVRHAAPQLPRGYAASLDEMAKKFSKDLWVLVPGMRGQKIKLYLYPTRERYLAGSFNPPPWSNAMTYALVRTVTTRATRSSRVIDKGIAAHGEADLGTIAHEMAHFYLNTVFEETQRVPPRWVNEGLAEVMRSETEASLPRDHRGPVPNPSMPMGEFIDSEPGKDDPGQWVGQWYQQAHSAVRFLMRGHPQAKFSFFCRRLKDGTKSAKALSLAYGYHSPEAFEKAWLKWLQGSQGSRLKY